MRQCLTSAPNGAGFQRSVFAWLDSIASAYREYAVRYDAEPSPVARGRDSIQASISDAGQRTARCPIRIGQGNSPALMRR